MLSPSKEPKGMVLLAGLLLIPIAPLCKSDQGTPASPEQMYCRPECTAQRAEHRLALKHHSSFRLCLRSAQPAQLYMG